MHRLSIRAAIFIAGLFGVIALVVPATSAASTNASSSISSSAIPSTVIAKAEAVGQPNVLLKYSPATGSWSQVATVDQPFAAAVTPDVVAAPEISAKTAFACLLLTWTIGACDDIAVVFKQVTPSTASGIISSLETVDEDDLEQTKETYNMWLEKDHILQGADATSGDEAEGGFEDAAGDGVEDDAVDFGGDFVDVVIDVLFWG